jgi:membrane-bound metal-dependent hydrolase YbcI (DUF457 family)
MTIFEHALIGVNGTLALGLGKRFGWPIVAWAAVASVLPDWDGVCLLLGTSYYGLGHRIWGHNLLITAILTCIVGSAVYGFDLLQMIQRGIAHHWIAWREIKCDTVSGDEKQSNSGGWWLWMMVGIAASYCHLLADIVFSAGKNLPIWGVPLLWPFSGKETAYPLIPWGDLGVTLILAGSMFVMLRFPQKIRLIALGSLFLVVIYAIVRGIIA